MLFTASNCFVDQFRIVWAALGELHDTGADLLFLNQLTFIQHQAIPVDPVKNTVTSSPVGHDCAVRGEYHVLLVKLGV